MSQKTLDDWIRENPVILISLMRGHLAASHLIIMQELRAIQGKPIDYGVETDKLIDLQKTLAEVFDMKLERELAQKLKERRESRKPHLQKEDKK
jgi:uncharacterized protein with ATP-grasp and redox domains